MKTCIQCGKEKSEDFYYKHRRVCKQCKKEADAIRRADPLTKIRISEMGKRLRYKYRREIFAALGGVCNRCHDDDHRILEVHHVGHNGNDPEEARISRQSKRMLARVIKYPKEYELLCCRCHTIHHYETGTDNRIITPKANSPY